MITGKVYFNPKFIWNGLRVHIGPQSHNDPNARPPSKQYEQARVMGGGSSINGQLANRGAPTDYDEWGELGADIYIDGKNVGRTPKFGVKLTAGNHTIRAVNEQLGLDETQTITVVANETSKVLFGG